MIVAIGSQGLAKQVYPHFKGCGFDVVFFDDTENPPKNLHEYQVINDLEFIEKQIKNGIDVYFTICIGNPVYRKKFYDTMIDIGAVPAGIESNMSSVSSNKVQGYGNIILDFALIEDSVIMGNNNLINCYAGLFHDVVIGDHNEIMPGAKLLGNSRIGNSCRIGSNSTILPNVSLCDGVIIGAGAVVTKSIYEPGIYVGVPAIRNYK